MGGAKHLQQIPDLHELSQGIGTDEKFHRCFNFPREKLILCFVFPFCKQIVANLSEVASDSSENRSVEPCQRQAENSGI